MKEEYKTLIAIVPLGEAFLPTDDILSLRVGVTTLSLKVRPKESQLVTLEDHELPFPCKDLDWVVGYEDTITAFFKFLWLLLLLLLLLQLMKNSIRNKLS